MMLSSNANSIIQLKVRMLIDACFPVVSFQEIEQLRMALKREILKIEVSPGFALPQLSQPILMLQN